MHHKPRFIKKSLLFCCVILLFARVSAQNNIPSQENDTVVITDTVLVSKYGEIKKPLFGTTIKRWNESKHEPVNKSIALQFNSNIFEDYSWTKPVFTGIYLETDEQLSASFIWKKKKCSLKTESETLSITTSDGKTITGINQKTDKCYFDINQLPIKKTQAEQWVYKTAYKKLYFPEVSKVANTIEQRNEKGEYYTSTYYTYTTNYTIKCEPTTSWVYKLTATETIDIPTYDISIFDMGNKEQLIVYKVIEDGSISYYLQNCSYISAVDNENVKHIIVDANANGCYFDPEDMILFNTWNPYLKKSTYSQSKKIKENEWFTLEYINKNLFLEFSADDNFTNLLCKNENDQFIKSNKKGCVQFHKLPKDAQIFINGQLYDIGEKVTRSEYGRFYTVIKSNGSLDYDRTYRLDSKRPYRHITYKKQADAGTVDIVNTKSSLFVEVTNAEGYRKQHINANKINVPIGNTKLRIVSNEITLLIDTLINHKETIKVDLKKEFQKSLVITDSMEIDTVNTNNVVTYFKDTIFVKTITNEPLYDTSKKAERRVVLSSFTNNWVGLDLSFQQSKFGTRFGLGYSNTISKPLVLRYQHSLDYGIKNTKLKASAQFGGNLYIPTKYTGYPDSLSSITSNDFIFSPFVGTAVSYHINKFIIETSFHVVFTNYWFEDPIVSGVSANDEFWKYSNNGMLNIYARFDYGLSLYYKF